MTTVGLIVAILLARGRSAPNADFYAVISHRAMIVTFGTVAVFILSVHIAGLSRFWSESGEGFGRFLYPSAFARAVRDVLSLANLSGGGAGCTYPDQRHSQARRRFHHFTFYGFMLCFASTTTAAIYHYALGLRAWIGGNQAWRAIVRVMREAGAGIAAPDHLVDLYEITNDLEEEGDGGS